MNKKLVFLITLGLVSISFLSVILKIQRAEAPLFEGIIINTDGSVTPLAAPISSSDNITYTFTDNINESILVQRSNITIDGAGYKLYGPGSAPWYVGIHAEYVAYNVTIQHVNIIEWETGIALISTNDNKVFENNITDNIDGIWLVESMNNTISGNYIKNNTNGIFLNTVFFSTFSGNNITQNDIGIRFEGASVHDNKFYHNYFINNINQTNVEPDNPNIWDGGYPSGGNYWSDFEERYPAVENIYSGSYPQSEPGSDGFWDGPYEIDADNIDHYPIVPEFSLFLILPLFMITTLLAVTTYKRKHLL